MTGLVVKNTGFWYLVLPEGQNLDNSLLQLEASQQPAVGGLIPCKVKGNFRLKGIRTTNPVAVGDMVTYDVNQEGFAFISAIQERRNYIIRKSINLSKQAHILATNLDLVLLIVTVNHPQTSTTFIDRFLATAEAYDVPVILAINKTDLWDDEDRSYAEQLAYLYRSIGYEVLQISARTGIGIDALHEKLRGKTTLISGNSGVGKSSLLNSLIPDINTKTAELSDVHDQGMHTTTFSEMYRMDIPPETDSQSGQDNLDTSTISKGTPTYLIDTPGIKGFGTIEFEKESVGHYFKEIFRISAQCRFGNCTHTHEPGCAVLQALEDHLIAQSRYDSYLSILLDENEGKYRE
ncbi:MAG: ribosome small subunit-dependent GTPase A [Bacteroidales bacterium]|nr:ribosome small subunit-dependent GTPase A [Bacteroidales bacterium]